jgi:hypothetical protein
MLRCSQLANVQVFDEDGVKGQRMVRKREIADLRRDGSAVSPHDSVEEIDFLMDNIEVLLSCPHANPNFVQKHKYPGCKSAQWLWKGLWQSLIA